MADQENPLRGAAIGAGVLGAAGAGVGNRLAKGSSPKPPKGPPAPVSSTPKPPPVRNGFFSGGGRPPPVDDATGKLAQAFDQDIVFDDLLDALAKDKSIDKAGWLSIYKNLFGSTDGVVGSRADIIDNVRRSRVIDVRHRKARVVLSGSQFQPYKLPPSQSGVSGPRASGVVDNLKQDFGLVLGANVLDATDGDQDEGLGLAAGLVVGKYGLRGARALGNRLGGAGGVKPPPAGKFRGPNNQTFAGVNAKTADKAALGRAQNMEAEGASRDDIWDATGWYKGVDGKWRFEIDDSGARMSDLAVNNIVQKGKTSGKVAGVLQHKELYEAYPELRDTDALVSSKPPKGVAYRGVWNSANGVYPRAGVAVETTQITGPHNARGILLHEMGGHGVQDIEGFATGGAPDTFKSSRYETDVWREAHRLANADEQSLLEMTEGAQKKYLAAARENLYTRLAGETEARNVQTRRNFTPEERRARRPWETQDVPDDQQIVRFGGGKAESRPKGPPTGNRLGKPKPPGTLSRMVAGGAIGGIAGGVVGEAGGQEDLTSEIANTEGKISTVEQEIAALKKAKADFDKITDPFEKQRFLKAAGLYPGKVDGINSTNTTDGINAWEAKNAKALEKAEADKAANRADLDELKKRDAYRQIQKEQNPFLDAVRELGPSGAAILGGVAATVLRIRGVGKSKAAVKVIENDINDLLTKGPVKGLMKKGGADMTERNRAVNMNEFYRQGGMPDNKLPFNYGAAGYKPNPKAAKPGALYKPETTTKMDGVGSQFVRPTDVKIIGAGLFDAALVTPFVDGAKEELRKAEEDVANGNESIEALRRVEKAKTNVAMYEAVQRLGLGIAGAGALSLGYRYKLPRPDIRGAEEEVAAISNYLKSIAPPKTPRAPRAQPPPPAPPPPPMTNAAPSNQLLLPLPPPKPKKPKKP